MNGSWSDSNRCSFNTKTLIGNSQTPERVAPPPYSNYLEDMDYPAVGSLYNLALVYPLFISCCDWSPAIVVGIRAPSGFG